MYIFLYSFCLVHLNLSESLKYCPEFLAHVGGMVYNWLSINNHATFYCCTKQIMDHLQLDQVGSYVLTRNSNPRRIVESKQGIRIQMKYSNPSKMLESMKDLEMEI